MASTIITAPSTISPKSRAPRLIRLADTPKVLHHAQRKQHAQRNHGGHHQPGPPVAQQHQQHHHHNHAALKQVLGHGVDGGVHELGAVEEGPDEQAGGQLAC